MKSLAKNSLFNVIYKCSSVVFPLIMAAYVARILSPDGVGRVASAQNIVTYFTILAALGLPTYGTKSISATKNRDELSKTFGELFVINAISTTFSWIAYYVIVLSMPYFEAQRPLYMVTGLLILFNYINVDWFYQGKEEFRYIMLRSLVMRVVSLIAVFVFVKTAEDYIVYALILSLSKVGNYIFNVVHIGKYIDYPFKNLNLYHHIKPVLILLAASLAIEVYTLADTTMLSIMCGERSVGFYSSAMRGIAVARMLITSIVGVFLPRLSYLYANGNEDQFNVLVNKGYKILLYLTIPAAVGIFIVANDLTLMLYGEQFLPSAVTTRIFSLSIITVGFSNFIGYQILVTIKKEKLMFYSTLLGAGVNVLLNYFLIRTYAHNGAAIASVITEFCVTCLQIHFVKDVVKTQISRHFMFSLILSNVTMILCVCVTEYLISNLFLRLVASVLVGVATYFLMTILTKNELSRETMGCFLRK